MSKLTMPDLRNVLGGIQQLVAADNPNRDNDDFQAGEHIVIISSDAEGTPTWELSVIESTSGQVCRVSMFISAKCNKSLWVFPEDAIIKEVAKSLIFLQKVQVCYHKSLQIN